MGDECTDVTSMEELSLCLWWLKDGKSVEHSLVVLHVMRTDTETLTSAITTYLQEKHIDVRCMRGMGFDSAATFSGRKSGVQTRLRELSPHTIFFYFTIVICQLNLIQGTGIIVKTSCCAYTSSMECSRE